MREQQLAAEVNAFTADIAKGSDLLVLDVMARQGIEPQQLEELRLLTSAEMDAQSPLALLLVGQPTLARQLRMGVFAALDQRVATRYQIAPMDLAESAQYLRHHLALVGRTDPLIADDAIARLHKASLGLPRALNNAAIAALSKQASGFTEIHTTHHLASRPCSRATTAGSSSPSVASMANGRSTAVLGAAWPPPTTGAEPPEWRLRLPRRMVLWLHHSSNRQGAVRCASVSTG